jgi:hypothetical protein
MRRRKPSPSTPKIRNELGFGEGPEFEPTLGSRIGGSGSAAKRLEARKEMYLNVVNSRMQTVVRCPTRTFSTGSGGCT